MERVWKQFEKCMPGQPFVGAQAGLEARWLQVLGSIQSCMAGGKHCPQVAAARGFPVAWHHAESSLGSWTELISSGRVILAAKWRQNCWSFCTAPTDQTLLRAVLTPTWQIASCSDTDGWGAADFSLLGGAKAFLPFLAPFSLRRSVWFFLNALAIICRNFPASSAHAVGLFVPELWDADEHYLTSKDEKSIRALLPAQGCMKWGMENPKQPLSWSTQRRGRLEDI